MAWLGRPRPTCRRFASRSNVLAQAQAAWGSDLAALTHWWCRRFSRPPNDPLFVCETAAYWSQFFYEECLREREAIERDYQANASVITGTREEAEGRADDRKRLVRRYNQLGEVLGLPAEDPEGKGRG